MKLTADQKQNLEHFFDITQEDNAVVIDNGFVYPEKHEHVAIQYAKEHKQTVLKVDRDFNVKVVFKVATQNEEESPLAPKGGTAQEAPANDPPANDPPANDPPANDPPANDPPANDPPANDPPANDPPASKKTKTKAPKKEAANPGN